MKIFPQGSSELTHVAHLIEDISVAMLTTVEGRRGLTSRPMAALEMDVHGALWFFTDVSACHVHRLRVVSLVFIDASQGTYVSLSGRGEIETDRARIQHLWTALAKPWFPDGPDSPNLGLLKFLPNAADYWDAPDNKMVRAFGVMASVVARKPIARREHGLRSGFSAGRAHA